MEQAKKIIIVIVAIMSFLTINKVYAYNEKENNEDIKINSRKAVIIDRTSKKVLFGKKENERAKMASTTKIMTAMVVIQNTNLDNIVEVSKKAAVTGGSKLKLKKGDKITVKDLLYGLMLRSGNDAAVSLAEYVGGSVEGFANLMNENAKELGLINTHFVTPHGLDDEEHYTTAYELALIADYALENEIFAEIVRTKTTNIRINGQNRTINNTNELLGNLNGVYGVKTGFTNGAGRCLVTAVKRGDLDIICVVLEADAKKNRTKDSITLIEETFKKYELISLNEKINEKFNNWNNLNSKRIDIEKGDGSQLALKLENDEEIKYPILKDTKDRIKTNIVVDFKLKAPLKKDTQIGKMQVIYNDEIIKEIGIVSENNINKKRINNYMEDFFKNFSTYFEEVIR